MFLINNIKSNIVTIVWTVFSLMALYSYTQLFTQYSEFISQPNFLLSLKIFFMFFTTYLNVLVFMNYSLYRRHGKKGWAAADLIFSIILGFCIIAFITFLTVIELK